jgi:hypothetical protein
METEVLQSVRRKIPTQSAAAKTSVMAAERYIEPVCDPASRR